MRKKRMRSALAALALLTLTLTSCASSLSASKWPQVKVPERPKLEYGIAPIVTKDGVFYLMDEGDKRLLDRYIWNLEEELQKAAITILRINGDLK